MITSTYDKAVKDLEFKQSFDKEYEQLLKGELEYLIQEWVRIKASYCTLDSISNSPFNLNPLNKDLKRVEKGIDKIHKQLNELKGG